jgi:two-component system chemotaxis response regulator CheY
MAKILIVDDSETIRVELKEALESGGHTVVAGVDGNDGYAKAEANDYFDLIISDYNMPGADGITMLKKIKTLPRYETTPLAMLTTESSKELKETGKSAGIIIWIVKPFDKERLLSIMQKVFEKHPAR